MRAGEFTCPSSQTFTTDMLSPGDISIDSHESPKHLAVHLKRSKTDPFGAGAVLQLGATGDTLTSMLAYLAIRPRSVGPLFLFSSGVTLSRPRLVKHLREALKAAGMDDSHFSGHSFRIGAATTAAKAGLNDSFIKMLGRWKSSAFALYIRTPWQHLTAVSSALVAP